MYRSKLFGAALALSASVVAIAPAQAVTVNFDQSTNPASYAASGLRLNGFTISSDTFNGAVIVPSAPNYASVNGTGSTISFVDSLGRATTSNGFGLTTTGLNAGSGFYNGGTLTFFDTLGRVLGSQVFSPVGPNEGRSPIVYSNNFSGIASVGFTLMQNTSGPGLFALDNVNFNLASAVPEPASWALMILGMGVVGYSLRRRQKVATRVSFAR